MKKGVIMAKAKKKTTKKTKKQSDPEPEQEPIPFDVIIFDELALNDINMLYHIQCYMKDHGEDQCPRQFRRRPSW